MPIPRVFKYCRGCNYEFEVDHSTQESYVEVTPRGNKYHPVVDCDNRERITERV